MMKSRGGIINKNNKPSSLAVLQKQKSSILLLREKRGYILNNFCIRYRMQISMIDGNGIFEKTPELFLPLGVLYLCSM